MKESVVSEWQMEIKKKKSLCKTGNKTQNCSSVGKLYALTPPPLQPTIGILDKLLTASCGHFWSKTSYKFFCLQIKRCNYSWTRFKLESKLKPGLKPGSSSLQQRREKMGLHFFSPTAFFYFDAKIRISDVSSHRSKFFTAASKMNRRYSIYNLQVRVWASSDEFIWAGLREKFEIITRSYQVMGTFIGRWIHRKLL